MPSVTRQQLLQYVDNFRNPQYMKRKYGITILESQIAQADKQYQYFQRISQQTIKQLPDNILEQWPYAMTEEQRYQHAMKGIDITPAQSVLWQNILPYLIQHPNAQERDGPTIAKALAHLEGFLQINTYMGKFEDNEKLLSGEDNDTLVRIFKTAYQQFINRV